MISPFSSLHIIESLGLIEQFRFPRSRKKRIRAKWEKRQCNWRPCRKALQMPDGTLVMHPEMAQRLRESLPL